MSMSFHVAFLRRTPLSFSLSLASLICLNFCPLLFVRKRKNAVQTKDTPKKSGKYNQGLEQHVNTNRIGNVVTPNSYKHKLKRQEEGLKRNHIFFLLKKLIVFFYLMEN